MKRLIMLLMAAILSVAVGFTITASPSDARPSYLPRTFIIGPGSTETFFYILDKSRPPNQLYICGYIHDFTKNVFGGYDPHLSCWPY